MNFQDAIVTCLTKYIDFSGRASRSEYWWFYLFVLIASVVTAFVNVKVNMLVSLLLFLPMLAAGVRRFHDIDKSGWFLLIGLIPFGVFVVIYWFVQPGTQGPNRFGS